MSPTELPCTHRVIGRWPGVVREGRVSDEQMEQGRERGHTCPRKGGSPSVVSRRGAAAVSRTLSTGTGVSPLPSSAQNTRFNSHPPATNRLQISHPAQEEFFETRLGSTRLRGPFLRGIARFRMQVSAPPPSTVRSKRVARGLRPRQPSFPRVRSTTLRGSP